MEQIANTNLFGEIEPKTETAAATNAFAERQRKSKLAYEATAEVWRRHTYDFAVNRFLPAHSTFIFEDLSKSYESFAKEHGRAATANGRAFGGLQSRLLREGLIEKTGEARSRSNGSLGFVYRSLVYRRHYE